MFFWYTSSAISTMFSSCANLMMSFRLLYDRHCPVGLPAGRRHSPQSCHAQEFRHLCHQILTGSLRNCPLHTPEGGKGRCCCIAAPHCPLQLPSFAIVNKVPCMPARKAQDQAMRRTGVDEDDRTDGDAAVARRLHLLAHLCDVHAPAALLLQVVPQQLPACAGKPYRQFIDSRREVGRKAAPWPKAIRQIYIYIYILTQESRSTA